MPRFSSTFFHLPWCPERVERQARAPALGGDRSPESRREKKNRLCWCPKRLRGLTAYRARSATASFPTTYSAPGWGSVEKKDDLASARFRPGRGISSARACAEAANAEPKRLVRNSARQLSGSRAFLGVKLIFRDVQPAPPIADHSEAPLPTLCRNRPNNRALFLLSETPAVLEICAVGGPYSRLRRK